MKKLLYSIFISLFCIAALSTSAFAKKYINGIDANFPPFAYVDKTGKPAGLDIDAVDWIAKKLGFEVEHKPMDWNGIVASLTNNKIDFIASGLSVTSEREKVIDFTMPYWIVKQVLVVKEKSTLTSQQVMKGNKTIGVQSGTSDAQALAAIAQKDGNNFTLHYYDSAPMIIQDLLNGRIDAAAMNESPAADAVQKRPVKIIGEMGLAPEKFAYGIRKDDKELKTLLNKGIKMLLADPYWQELINKYQPDKH